MWTYHATDQSPATVAALFAAAAFGEPREAVEVFGSFRSDASD